MPKEEYKFEPHHFVPMSRVGKKVCTKCGLVALNNEATEWCIKRGCNYEEAKGYTAAMARLTRRK